MDERTAARRRAGGVELPAAGVWRIDRGHAQVGFVGRLLLVGRLRVRFSGVDGTVRIAERPEDSTVEVAVDMSTVSSGIAKRDRHLASADFFDVANHPTATFRSRRVTWDGTAGTMTGDLTIRGVSRPVTLAVDHLGHARGQSGGNRAVFSARARIDRQDWGPWRMPLAGRGLVVSREVTVETRLELVPVH